jgi:hypothetical protein
MCDAAVAVQGRTPGTLARQFVEVVAAVPRFATAPLVRRRHLRWGATDAEVAAAMPGDEHVPHPSFGATRAITIDAPPERVWPWLVQLGYGRAGWYSYDLLDNAARPSADRIVPELQGLAVGDRVPMAATENDVTAFRVAALEPPALLLWTKPGSSWVWTLTGLPAGRTRLVTRIRDSYEWSRPFAALLSLALFEFGDYPMMRKELLGIRARASTVAHGVANPPTE